MILLTTSRRPTATIRTFCKFLEKTFPDVAKISRGKSGIEDLLDRAIQLEAEKIVIVDRRKGGPSKIGSYVIKDGKMIPFTPTLYLEGLRIEKERLATVSYITIEDDISTEARKIAEVLARIFGLNISIGQRDLRRGAALQVTPYGTHGAKLLVVTEKGPGKSFVTINRIVV